MRNALTIVVIVALGLLMRLHFQQKKERDLARVAAEQEIPDANDMLPEREEPRSSRFDSNEVAVSDKRRSCDGRKRCPQMTSCEEATWFIEHCPGMEMDGDNDGTPCESQWCQD